MLRRIAVPVITGICSAFVGFLPIDGKIPLFRASIGSGIACALFADTIQKEKKRLSANRIKDSALTTVYRSAPFLIDSTAASLRNSKSTPSEFYDDEYARDVLLAALATRSIGTYIIAQESLELANSLISASVYYKQMSELTREHQDNPSSKEFFDNYSDWLFQLDLKRAQSWAEARSKFSSPPENSGNSRSSEDSH